MNEQHVLPVPSLEEIEQKVLNRQANLLFKDRRNSFGDIKIGRNEPCPCGLERQDGSRFKFKHCCGKDI
jgi:uncharacterized protein YchJ